MKKYLTLLFVICSGILSRKIYAQNHFAALEKNKNTQVKHLTHELNSTRDTLMLSSPIKIDRVYSLNKNIKRELEQYVFANSCKVPLKALSIGKHVFVVDQDEKKIVFVVRILRDYIDTSVEETKIAASGSN